MISEFHRVEDKFDNVNYIVRRFDSCELFDKVNSIVRKIVDESYSVNKFHREKDTIAVNYSRK